MERNSRALVLIPADQTHSNYWQIELSTKFCEFFTILREGSYYEGKAKQAFKHVVLT